MRGAPHFETRLYLNPESAPVARMRLARLHRILAATASAIVVGGAFARFMAIAIPIAGLKFHDLAHLAFQRGFDLCRLAFAPGNAAHIGGVNIETPGDSAIKSSQD
jgi:hypothetical protein